MSVFVLSVGIFSGFFSGLLGLGGGLIMTPMFLYGPSMAGAGALTVKEITGLTMVQGVAGFPRLSKAIPLSSSWSSCCTHTLVTSPD